MAELEDEDLAFVKKFLLASGSLKEVASVYGVSYPTVRLRLDRLIQKIRLSETVEALIPSSGMRRIHLRPAPGILLVRYCGLSAFNSSSGILHSVLILSISTLRLTTMVSVPMGSLASAGQMLWSQ